MLTIVGIPIGPDAYTACYYEALQRAGARVIRGDLSGRWLLANRRSTDYLHLNWPSFFYWDRSAIASLGKFVRFVLLIALARLCGIRLLWTAHNLYPHDRSRIAFLDRLGRTILVSLSHRVFAHGDSAAAIVAREFPRARGKLVSIPHGHWIGHYADETDRATARARLGIPPDQFVFLSFGSCREYKNLEHLTWSFQKGTFGKAALWIVGRFQEAGYAARVRRQIDQQPQCIRIVDRFVPDEEIQYYLAACNVVVLAYADVLTSGSAMLAISFGRPVIAPRLGHLQDVIGPQCGFLYEPSDAGGLTHAMAFVQGRKFDEALIRQHAHNFDWRDAAMKTISALQ